MLRTHEAVVTLLTADPAFAGLFPGGIWNRELLPSGAGSTPAAFVPVNPDDPSSPKVLRPSIVVRDAGEFMGSSPVGGNARVMVFAYAPASDAGRAILAQADARLRQTFSRVAAAVDAGDGGQRWGEFRVGTRTPILDERSYGGTMFCSWQLTFVTALLDMAAR